MSRKGITLIELLVVMAISTILVAAIYRSFLSQQHTYAVQDQVSDMQQNVRIGLNRMMREIRMAGYGQLNTLFATSDRRWRGDQSARICQSIVTPGGSDDEVSFVAAYERVSTLHALDPNDMSTIYLSSASAFKQDGDDKGMQYISLNGLESHRIQTIVPAIPPAVGDKVVLDSPLTEVHRAGEPVYRVVAITYSLGTSGGKQVLLRNTNVEGSAPEVVVIYLA
jgi:prepilin-type N-terminal cleavage/methylation domain-containing protein